MTATNRSKNSINGPNGLNVACFEPRTVFFRMACLALAGRGPAVPEGDMRARQMRQTMMKNIDKKALEIRVFVNGGVAVRKYAKNGERL